MTIARRLCIFLSACFALLHAAKFCAAQDDPAESIREFRGPTMATSYMVKVFGAPEVSSEHIRFRVDAELRRVNDQMSTYLKSSEITKFNDSESTDWISISKEFALVVDYALQVSQKTDGAFDVTVGPLVNAWSFGTEERTQTVPTEDTLNELKKSVGYQKLSVRLDPPAIRKSVPTLRIDLSAIAKGHGVDRVVESLNEMGIENLFVEIGGEVRTSGNKSGDPWKVGIQTPDAARDVVMIAHPMSADDGVDESMATSGDYRNVFTAEGKRYSHTIDPRTAAPIEHQVASVSVVAPTCMAADAWATALNVVGRDEAMRIADKEDLSVLMIERQEKGFEISGSGVLAPYAKNQYPQKSSVENQQSKPPAGSSVSGDQGNSVFAVLAITFVVFLIITIAMSVGVIFSGKKISGSCGGIANQTDGEGNVSCGLCSNPSDACKELREKMQTNTAG